VDSSTIKIDINKPKLTLQFFISYQTNNLKPNIYVRWHKNLQDTLSFHIKWRKNSQSSFKALNNIHNIQKKKPFLLHQLNNKKSSKLVVSFNTPLNILFKADKHWAYSTLHGIQWQKQNLCRNLWKKLAIITNANIWSNSYLMEKRNYRQLQ